MTTLRAAFRGFPLLFCLFGLLPASAQQPGAGGPRLAFLPRTTVIAAGEQSGDDGYGDGNLATQAGLTNPSGIAVDSAGNLFIATAGDNTVRRVDAVTGIISTVAGISPGSGGLGPGPGPGNGEHRPRGAGAPATTVPLNHPTSVVVDAAGDLYIASSFDGVIYKVDTSGNLTTYAGTLNSSGYSGDGAAATAAQLYSPTGLSLDASGNLFIADSLNNVIRRVDAASGVITTVAGNFSQGSGYGGDGAAATAAQLNEPRATAVDAAGNLFIADTFNYVIRRVDASTHTITTVAGNNGLDFSGNDGNGGPATAASLGEPYGVAVDAAGDLYFTDFDAGAIRIVNAAGTISTIATGYSNASGIALDASFNLYFGSLGAREIFKAGPGGLLDFGQQTIQTSVTQTVTLYNPSATTLQLGGYNIASTNGFTIDLTAPGACNFTRSLASGASCTMAVTFAPVTTGTYTSTITVNDNAADSPQTLTLTGIGLGITPNVVLGIMPDTVSVGLPATFSVSVTSPSGAPPVPGGQVVLTDFNTGSVIVTLVLDGNGNASYTSSSLPVGSDYYTAEYLGDATYADTVSNFEQLTVHANTATISLQASAAVLTYPATVTLTATLASNSTLSGNVNFYIDGGLLGSVPLDANGVATLTTTQIPPGVHGVQARFDNPNFALTASSVVSLTVHAGLLQFQPLSAYTVAGTPSDDLHGGYSGDGGPAIAARMNSPYAITVDAAGNQYIADELNNVIRRVDGVTGIITTYAGQQYIGSYYYTRFGGDGGPAVYAYLDNPSCVTLDSGGNLYICDYSNNVVRRVDAVTGIITTAVGAGGQSGGHYSDTGTASSIYLFHPNGIAFDKAGNMYISDAGNEVIRKVDKGGNVTTIAGSYYSQRVGNPASGVQATSTTLYNPSGIVVDPAGNVIFADSYYNAVRRIDAQTQIITTIAGGGYTSAPYGDGGPANVSTLQIPTSVALDPAGDVYINDSYHNLVRRIDTSGMISTVAGIVGFSGVSSHVDPAGSEALYTPLDVNTGIAIGPDGALYITDTANQTVLKAGTSGTLVFGPLTAGYTSAPQTLTLVNTGDRGMTFGVPPFTIVGDYTAAPGGAAPCDFSAVLASGASCTMLVSFAPTDSSYGGGTITFSSTAFNAPQVVHLVSNSTLATPAISFYTSSSAISYGDSVYLIAQVSGATVIPTGTVKFYNGSTLLGTASLSAGSGYVQVSGLPRGTFALTAVYGGDSIYRSVTSDPQQLVVGLIPTVTTLAASSTTIQAGDALGLTATVTTSAASPAGTVTFLDGTTSLGTVYVSGGTASLAVTLATSGTHQISARFDANANFAGSASPPITVQVTGGASVNFPDYTITGGALPLVIHRGNSASVTLTITPVGGYTGTVHLGCGTLPSYASCTFSTSDVALSSNTPQTVIWTINTTPLPAGSPLVRTVVSQNSNPHGLPTVIFAR